MAQDLNKNPLTGFAGVKAPAGQTPTNNVNATQSVIMGLKAGPGISGPTPTNNVDATQSAIMGLSVSQAKFLV